jgi:hypothetical protein
VLTAYQTPTPHRFLVPKRSQPRQETPKALQSGGQQFQATPRFSLHSTPRGSGGGGAPSHPSSSLRTPAPASTGAGVFFRPTPRNTDPINDIISSSPPFAEQRPGEGSHQHDPLEIDADSHSVDSDVDAIPESSPVQESSDHGRSNDGEEEDANLEGRSPKRRRISISSDFGFGDEAPSQDNPEERLEDHTMHDDAAVVIQSSLPDYEPANDEDMDSGSLLTSRLSAQQPTFQKAPRFKPVELPEGSGRSEPLPDAFSPHRKGAKYVPGGLAAEVRDWFVDVWAGTNAGAARRGGEEWLAMIQVDEVRAAPGMTLVTGRHVQDDDPSNDADPSLRSMRIMLAGSPRLSGLAKREDVKVGTVVGVGRPTWEVSLEDQGRWAVVCEWAILR